MHACAARTKVLVGNRRATLRNPEAPNCAGTQPLAGNPRVTTLLRDSSGPFLGARVLVRKKKKVLVRLFVGATLVQIMK